MYESEFTQFIRQYLKEHPEEIKQQADGRALWWDHPQNIEEQRRIKDSQVPHTK